MDFLADVRDALEEAMPSERSHDEYTAWFAYIDIIAPRVAVALRESADSSFYPSRTWSKRIMAALRGDV